MAKTALIVGATSSLGNSICHQLARQGWDLIISGRNKEELSYLASDLSIRYNTKTRQLPADLSFIDFSAFEFISSAREYATNIDALFILAGEMGANLSIKTTTNINYTVPAQIISEFASSTRKDGKVDIVVVSSVAGDRGRQSNYIYGSAKAALSSFCSGMRNKYSSSNIHIMTVKPGFLDTPMTYGMQSPLICDREKAASIIIGAMTRRKNIIYVPFFWRFIMLIIIHIPERIFKRLKL